MDVSLYNRERILANVSGLKKPCFCGFSKFNPVVNLNLAAGHGGLLRLGRTDFIFKQRCLLLDKYLFNTPAGSGRHGKMQVRVMYHLALARQMTQQFRHKSADGVEVLGIGQFGVQG
jgi:hypothetical protein